MVRVSWLGRGGGEVWLVEAVREQVERLFAVRTERHSSADWPASAYDQRRSQLSSTHILAWMVSELPADGSKALALTDVDLFIPILSFVFGEAQLRGRAAVVSTARLRDPAGGTHAPLLAARLVKEAAHELGHTFGLLHCERPQCAMSRSTNLADVDRKGAELCRDCRVRLADLRREEVLHA